jgi:hypothetical protein
MKWKDWVKVYLSDEQKRLLKRIAESLGIGESKVLRQAFMEYAKSISLITEKVHGKIREVGVLLFSFSSRGPLRLKRLA